MKKIWAQKGHVTFQGQGHVISRSLILILVAYVRMHLCAKFDANRTVYCEGADSDKYGGIARGRCRLLYFNKTFNGHHIFN